MPEFVLQLWAAQVLRSAKPLATLIDTVPPGYRHDVTLRVAAMSRRIRLQNARS